MRLYAGGRTMPSTLRRWSTLLTLIAATVLLAGPASAQTPGKKPNILVIMGDDVGWFNIGA